MTTVTRQQFTRALENHEVGVSSAPRDVRSAFQRADVDGDGTIAGAAETNQLFTELDRLDRDGSRNSLVAARGERLTPAGTGMQAALQNARPRRAMSETDASAPQGRVVGQPRSTAYYPANTRMEGGFVDKRGKPLQTLQDYVDARRQHPNDPSKWPPYVSIALDNKLYTNGVVKYGDRFRIPELEQKYGMPIEFRAVDTGGAFRGRGFSRVDVCVRDRRASLDPSVNTQLTLVRM